jgi:serine/threonine protein kinase
MRTEYVKLVENILNKKNNILIEHLDEKDVINSFLAAYNDEVHSYLGKGDFGTAYLTKNNRVVKQTSNKQEVEICKQIKENPKENLVNIYDVNEEHQLIYQEYIEEDSHIEDLFYRVSELLDNAGISFGELRYFDEDEYEEQNGPIDDETKKFLGELNAVLYDANQFVQYPDLRPENLGRSKDGTLKFFDIVGR